MSLLAAQPAQQPAYTVGVGGCSSSAADSHCGRFPLHDAEQLHKAYCWLSAQVPPAPQKPSSQHLGQAASTPFCMCLSQYLVAGSTPEMHICSIHCVRDTLPHLHSLLRTWNINCAGCARGDSLPVSALDAAAGPSSRDTTAVAVPAQGPNGVYCRATLVVCPLVAVIQWRQEIARFTAPGALKVGLLGMSCVAGACGDLYA